MAKDVGRYGAQADVADLQFQLREKNESISQLELQLETSRRQEQTTLELFEEKKKKYLELEDKLADAQAEVGKWKFLVSQKGGSSGDSGRRNSRDLENKLQTLEAKNKHFESEIRGLESEKRRLQQQILFAAPPPLAHHDSRRVQQLEQEVYKLQQANTNLDQRLRKSQDDQQKLHVDLKYARAELGEFQHRLHEKTQENLKNRDIIAHLESRQRDGAFDSTTQARIKHLEDHILQLEQQRSARRMSEPSSPSLRRQLTELKDESAALKAEAITYQEDFLRERQDRGKEHSRFLEADARAKRAEQRVLDLEAIVTALNN